MSRARNGIRGRPAGTFTSGVALFPSYKETVTSVLVGTAVVTQFAEFALDELLGDLDNRFVVIQRFLIEVIPKFNADNAVFAQASLANALTGATTIFAPMSPYKLLSNVNPTMLSIDVVKMGRIAPHLLRPLSSASQNIALSVAFKDLPLDSQMALRVTTFARLLPDVNIRTVTFASQREDPKGFKDAEDAEMIENSQ